MSTEQQDFMQASRAFLNSLEGATDEEKQFQLNMFTLQLFMNLYNKVEQIYEKICKSKQ